MKKLRGIILSCILFVSISNVYGYSKDTLRKVKHALGAVLVTSYGVEIYTGRMGAVNCKSKTDALLSLLPLIPAVSYKLLASALEEDDWYQRISFAIYNALCRQAEEKEPNSSNGRGAKMVEEAINNNPFFRQFVSVEEILGPKWKGTPLMVFLLESGAQEVAFKLINSMVKKNIRDRMTRRIVRASASVVACCLIDLIGKCFHAGPVKNLFYDEEDEERDLSKSIVDSFGKCIASIVGLALVEIGGEQVAQALIDADELNEKIEQQKTEQSSAAVAA